MAEKIVMFALSPTMEAGTILKWNKKEGESITNGEAICEVETDKSSMDYESAQEGVLLKIIIQEGQSAVVGQTIAVIGSEGEDFANLLVEIENESSTSKDSNKEDEEPSEEEKALEMSKPPKTTSKIIEKPSSSNVVTTKIVTTNIRVKASPLAKKLAAEKGIPLSQIRGTGPGGRIVRKDVENAPTEMVHSGLHSSVGMGAPLNISTPVKGARAVIAQRLSESKFSAPHFYVKNTVRIEEMMSLRQSMNANLPDKLSLNAFIIGFVAQAIKDYPEINSSWHGDTIVQYGSIDIGLAVDLGSGLYTPVIRNCGNKGIYTIDQELKLLIEKVRDKSISAEEYTGATFTISNLGSFGVDEFTAIINPPGAAILAVGRGRKIPVVNKNGELEIGEAMTLTLSSDHRVIDGSLAGRFISKLQGIIEVPGLALL